MALAPQAALVAAGGVAANVGANLLTSAAEAGHEYLVAQWFGESGMLNHDIAHALVQALQTSLSPDTLVEDFKKNHRNCPPNEVGELEIIAQEMAKFMAHPQAEFRQAIANLEAQPRQLLETQQTDVLFKQYLTELLRWSSDTVKYFIKERFSLARLHDHFIEALKQNERAQFALQLLFQESLEAGLAIIKMNTETIKHDLTALRAELQAYQDIRVQTTTTLDPVQWQAIQQEFRTLQQKLVLNFNQNEQAICQYIARQTEAVKNHVTTDGELTREMLRQLFQGLQRQDVEIYSLKVLVSKMLVSQGRADFSEDGSIVDIDQIVAEPQESFYIEDPTGTVKVRSKFYIERGDADHPLKRQIINRGSITTVRAPRQGGKSSLLARGIHHAEENKYKVVRVDLQEVDPKTYHAKEPFLYYLSECITRKLRLDRRELETAWQGSQNPQDKFGFFMEDYILPQLNLPLVLMLDEVDRLFDTDFYGNFFAMMRAWHNKAAGDELWEKLNIVLVISTEPHLLIPNLNQSPFNVGLQIYLKDFNEAQVADLNQRHGGPVNDRELPELMTWLNGHPYLTRRALYTMVTERLAWAELLKLALNEEGPFGDHLKYQYRLVQERAELRSALQQVMRGQLPDEAILHRLNKAGLVKGSGQSYTLRCELYERYFKMKGW